MEYHDETSQKMIEIIKAVYKHRNFVIRNCLPLPWGYIHVLNHEKFYVKSKFEAVLLKLAANEQSNYSFLLCPNFTPLELPAPAHPRKKMVFGL